jgi:hypothetical protein
MSDTDSPTLEPHVIVESEPEKRGKEDEDEVQRNIYKA